MSYELRMGEIAINGELVGHLMGPVIITPLDELEPKFARISSLHWSSELGEFGPMGRVIGHMPANPATCSVEMTIGTAEFVPDTRPRPRPKWLQKVPGPSRFKRRAVRAWKKSVARPPVQVKWPTKLVVPECRLTQVTEVTLELRAEVSDRC